MQTFFLILILPLLLFAQNAKSEAAYRELQDRKTNARSEFTKEDIDLKKQETLSPNTTRERYHIQDGEITFTDTVRIIKGRGSKDFAIQTTGQKFIRETHSRSRDGSTEAMILSFNQQNTVQTKNNKVKENYTQNTEIQLSIPFSVAGVNNITKEVGVPSDNKRIVYYEVILASSNDRIHNLNNKKNSVVNAKIRDIKLANATYIAIIKEQQIEIVQLKEEIKHKDEIISDLKAGRQPRERTPKEPKEQTRTSYQDPDRLTVVEGVRMLNPYLITRWLLDKSIAALETGENISYREFMIYRSRTTREVLNMKPRRPERNATNQTQIKHNNQPSGSSTKTVSEVDQKTIDRRLREMGIE